MSCPEVTGDRVSDNPPAREAPREPREKQQCFQWESSQSCTFEGSCRFWHGETAPARQQNRRRNNNFGNRGGNNICFGFQEKGSCHYGDNCRYSHDLNGAQNDGGSGYGGGFSSGGDRRGDRGDRGDRGGDRGGYRRNNNSGGGFGGRGQNDGVCFNWRDRGECDYGEGCRFKHGDAPREGMM